MSSDKMGFIPWTPPKKKDVISFPDFLRKACTPWHAVHEIEKMAKEYGAIELKESDYKLMTREEYDNLPEERKAALGEYNPLEMIDLISITPQPGELYYVKRGGSIILFRMGENSSDKFRVVVSHTDSPCLKLKENPALSDENYTRLNTETYGGGLWYTFFDRPLKLAGRIVTGEEYVLTSELFESSFNVVLPSLAIHMNREANEKFAPNMQTELPLLSLGKTDFDALLVSESGCDDKEILSYDILAVPDDKPFLSGVNDEFISSPRLDDLSGVYTAVQAFLEVGAAGSSTLVCACLEAEEIGSRTYAGAAADFLYRTLERIAIALNVHESKLFARSMLVSLDNAHALHPNHPEKCDPTNRPVMGGGVVIKAHAGGAYTSDAMTTALIKRAFNVYGVPYQMFYNRSDMRSGSTLGAISLSQASIPSVDIGLAQLAMHSAVETMATSDLEALYKGLTAFYSCDITYMDDVATVGDDT